MKLIVQDILLKILLKSTNNQWLHSSFLQNKQQEIANTNYYKSISSIKKKEKSFVRLFLFHLIRLTLSFRTNSFI